MKYLKISIYDGRNIGELSNIAEHGISIGFDRPFFIQANFTAEDGAGYRGFYYKPWKHRFFQCRRAIEKPDSWSSEEHHRPCNRKIKTAEHYSEMLKIICECILEKKLPCLDIKGMKEAHLMARDELLNCTLVDVLGIDDKLGEIA